MGMAVVTGDTSTGQQCGSLFGSCKNTQAPERTYLWRAPFAGTFRFDTAGSSFPSVVYLRAGGCTGTELGCDRADTLDEGGFVILRMEEGDTVVVVVDGQQSARGPFQLNITSSEQGRCGNGIDDDGDGSMDCSDTDCGADLFCCGDDGTACVCL